MTLALWAPALCFYFQESDASLHLSWVCSAALRFLFLAELGVCGGSWVSHPAAGGILVPGPGTEPVSPELEGGLLTAGPPGKSFSA